MKRMSSWEKCSRLRKKSKYSQKNRRVGYYGKQQSWSFIDSLNDCVGMAASSDTSSSCSSSVPQTKPGVDSGLEANVGLPISSVKGSDGTFIWKIPEITRRARDATKKKVTFFYSPPFYAGRSVHCMYMCWKVEFLLLHTYVWMLTNDLLM